MAAEKVTVRLGQLTKPLVPKKINAGTTLEAFLEKNGFSYSSAVRVNGQVTKREAVLRANDVITVIEDVDGGLA